MLGFLLYKGYLLKYAPTASHHNWNHKHAAKKWISKKQVRERIRLYIDKYDQVGPCFLEKNYVTYN